MGCKFLTMGVLSGVLIFANSCSSKKATPPSSSSKKVGCSSKSSKTSNSNLRSSFANGFGLLATTYDDIADIIETNCESCHTAGGVGNLDLSTYTALKKNSTKVITTINSDDDDKMPPDGKMSDSKISKIQAWVDDGKLGSSDSTNSSDEEVAEEEEESTSSSSKPDPCEDGDEESSGSSSGDDDDLETDSDTSGGTTSDDPVEEVKKEEIDPELFKIYIEPVELKNCHAEGKTFLRTGTKDPDDPTPRCDTVNYPAKFNCDQAGVLAAFSNDPTVTTAVNQYVGEGYIFDQCGEAGGKPVVYFVCFSGEDGKCIAPKDLVGANLTISTASIGRP